MDGGCGPSILKASVRRARAICGEPGTVAVIKAELGQEPLEAILLFVSAEADFDRITADVSEAFPDTTVVACTTAGEICEGYFENSVVAVGLPRAAFTVLPLVVENLSALDEDQLADRLFAARSDLTEFAPRFEHEFDFLVVDSLSMQEDYLVSSLAGAVGPVPLIGGSASGGEDAPAMVGLNGQSYRDAAILLLVRTLCPVKVFTFDHIRPLNRRMVVTDADPAQRIVRQINAEPAALEYARVIGTDPEQLSPYTFAANPLVVRMGHEYYVRSIKEVTEDGALKFFCAIDEGMILTLAETLTLAEHLDSELKQLENGHAPQMVLACESNLRRIEAEELQLGGRVSALMKRYRISGFSTHGEQLNALHLNQTFTGVAIYPPKQ